MKRVDRPKKSINKSNVEPRNPNLYGLETWDTCVYGAVQLNFEVKSHFNRKKKEHVIWGLLLKTKLNQTKPNQYSLDQSD